MARLDILKYDLATAEKLPVIQDLLRDAAGPFLDLGSGTGDLTAEAFVRRPAIAVDSWLPNLLGARRDFGAAIRPVQAHGDSLPLSDGTIGTVLCSEVLEHIENDTAVVREIARILRPGGHLILTVPSLRFGVDTYLRFLRIRTVHDFPGPEQHVRRGYREGELREMFGSAGLDVEEVVYLFKPFAKLGIDLVAAAHLAYQRVVHRRTQWTWSDVVEPGVQNGVVFRVYRLVYPLLRGLSRLDRLFRLKGGFGIAVRARRAER